MISLECFLFDPLCSKILKDKKGAKSRFGENGLREKEKGIGEKNSERQGHTGGTGRIPQL